MYSIKRELFRLQFDFINSLRVCHRIKIDHQFFSFNDCHLAILYSTENHLFHFSHVPSKCDFHYYHERLFFLSIFFFVLIRIERRAVKIHCNFFNTYAFCPPGIRIDVVQRCHCSNFCHLKICKF